MRRFFVLKTSDKQILEGDEHKHLSLVLRAKTGEEIVLCPNDGYDYVYRIKSIESKRTVLTFLEKKANAAMPKIRLSVFVALLKGDKLDLVAQKLTELGVTEIYPFTSRYISVKPISINIERLRRIVVEAAKQCGLASYPKVNEVIDFDAMTALTARSDLKVFLYEQATQLDLKSYLLKSKTCENPCLIIGSEGGFSEEEASKIALCGATPLTIGKRILRAETACIAAASAIMYEFEEWK